ncbi:MAG: DUF615 domain-containing protein [Acidiferrobacterales bacterium]|nr:DUF615 domain-containing protein [Acidiferrobacterales bacterium]
MSEKEYAVRPNKTQLKREMRALNDLSKELIALPESALDKFPLNEETRHAVADGRRFSRGALQRQLRRIAKLLQQEDLAAINVELVRLKQPTKKQTAEFHQLEQWRDRLIDGDETLLTKLIAQHPVIDPQYIRQLIRNAVKERKLEKAPKSARLLFKYLSKIRNSDEDITGYVDHTYAERESTN